MTTDFNPKTGDMILVNTNKNKGGAVKREFVGRTRYGDYAAWDKDRKYLIVWKFAWPVDEYVVGEIYMVRRGEYDPWTPRRYAGDGNFYIVDICNEETQRSRKWKCIREATDEEKRGYLNPWRELDGKHFPDCFPFDHIECKRRDGKLVEANNADMLRFLWNNLSSDIVAWRYWKEV